MSTKQAGSEEGREWSRRVPCSQSWDHMGTHGPQSCGSWGAVHSFAFLLPACCEPSASIILDNGEYHIPTAPLHRQARLALAPSILLLLKSIRITSPVTLHSKLLFLSRNFILM